MDSSCSSDASVDIDGSLSQRLKFHSLFWGLRGVLDDYMAKQKNVKLLTVFSDDSIALFLVRGEAEIGIQQMPALMAIPAINIVGLLPGEVQRVDAGARPGGSARGSMSNFFRQRFTPGHNPSPRACPRSTGCPSRHPAR